jgi:hypothetical protein
MAAVEARVPARYFLPLLDWLRGEGTDVAALLRMAGLDSAQVESRDATLQPAQFDALVASARRLTGRTDLGFQAGRHVQQTMHELLGFGMLGCRNLDEVMRLVARHYHLMTETLPPALAARRCRRRRSAVHAHDRDAAADAAVLSGDARLGP